MKKTTEAAEALLDVLVPTTFVTMAILSKIGADNDLSLTLIRALGILSDRRLRMAELADHLGLKKSTMSGLIDRAEQRGLVTRAPNAVDERAIDVFLTSEGMAYFARLRAQGQDALGALTERLNLSEQRLLTDLLSRMLYSPEN